MAKRLGLYGAVLATVIVVALCWGQSIIDTPQAWWSRLTSATGILPVASGGTGNASGQAADAVKVNGVSVPASKTVVGTNSSAQIIDSSSATLANNTTGNAATATNLTFTPVTTDYSTAAIALGGDSSGVWSDVDATNATVSATVIPGVFEVWAQFGVIGNFSDAAINKKLQDAFRLTDGTTNTPPVEVMWITVVGGDAQRGIVPVMIKGYFTYAAGGAKTFKLQKMVAATAGTITVNNIDCDGAPGHLYLGIHQVK